MQKYIFDSVAYVDRKQGPVPEAPLTRLISLDPAHLLPVRTPTNHLGQANRIGYYWFAKTGRHLLYESRLEALAYQMLDFDPSVRFLLPQPFFLKYRLGRKRFGHIPDILCHRHNKPRLVVDVKPEKYLDKPRTQQDFQATRAACEEIGWEYVVWSEPDRTFYYNLRFLGGYRRPPVYVETLAPTIRTLLSAGPVPVFDLASLAGPSYFTLPVIYHLVWKRVLYLDLSLPLRRHSLVSLTLDASHE